MQKKITVIGAGSWGTAIAMLLDGNGHNVTLWSRRKEQAEELKNTLENKKYLSGIVLSDKVTYTGSIEKALCDAETVFMVVPSNAVCMTSKNIAPYIKKGTIVVNAAKGLEQESLRRLSEVISENIPQAEVAVLSGPSHAEEVARRLPTTNVVVSSKESTSKAVQDIMMCDMFRVYTADDMIGVEMGGALKNVIALCAGISDGLGYGDNTKAALMTRGMREIARLGTAMGAKESTFFGLSGIGDLFVTCASMNSRNRRAGILIGQGLSPEEAVKNVQMVVEGFYTAKSAKRLAEKMKVEMPITEQAYKILFENKPPKEAVLELMCREKKYETEKNLLR